MILQIIILSTYFGSSCHKYINTMYNCYKKVELGILKQKNNLPFFDVLTKLHLQHCTRYSNTYRKAA